MGNRLRFYGIRIQDGFYVCVGARLNYKVDFFSKLKFSNEVVLFPVSSSREMSKQRGKSSTVQNRQNLLCIKIHACTVRWSIKVMCFI